MTTARHQLVDPEVTRFYHCISRCVRQASLLSEDGALNRKGWLENRLQVLSEIFAISVLGYAILDNHLHTLIRLDPARGDAWSDEDVIRRWAILYPPRDKQRNVTTRLAGLD